MQREMDDYAIGTFCRNMELMIRAGITPEEAVELLSEQQYNNDPLGDSLDKLKASMRNGNGFADAVRETGAIPEYAAGMIYVGETTGRLEEIFKSLAAYYERRHSIRLQVKNALLYPCILLMMMCAALILMIEVVLPAFSDVYNSMAGILTNNSYGYITASVVIGWASLIVTAVISVAIIGGIIAFRSPRGKQAVMIFLEKFPLTKKAVRDTAASRMADIVATYLKSGIDETSAVIQAEKLVTHTELKKSIGVIHARIEEGQSFAKCVYDQKIFSSLYGRMLLSGEKSGDLSGTMATISERTGQEADERVKRTFEVLEPMLTGFLTFSVGVTLLCAMVPLIGILSAVG